MTQTKAARRPASQSLRAPHYRAVLLLGAPGSGKGTQGRILDVIPGFYHFSSGDAFRRLQPDEPMARLFRQYSDRGRLVPDEPTVAFCLERLAAAAEERRFRPALDTVILDGLPRNVRQAELLRNQVEVKLVLYLACADLTPVIERLARRARQEGRTDDADMDVIRQRIETYERATRPVLDFYGAELVRPIDALRTPLGVLQQVVGELVRVAGA